MIRRMMSPIALIATAMPGSAADFGTQLPTEAGVMLETNPAGWRSRPRN